MAKRKKIGQLLQFLFVTLALLIAADQILGSICCYLYRNTSTGELGQQNYCITAADERVLILGSSRALHHYDTEIIRDSLNLSCLNAGLHGQCIYYQYALLSACLERGYKPDLIIMDIVERDIEISWDEFFNLDVAIAQLSPYIGSYRSIDSLLSVSPWQKQVANCSLLYRCNSKIIDIVRDQISDRVPDNGFLPLSGNRINVNISERGQIHQSFPVEPLKSIFLQKLITLCQSNKISLFFVISPSCSDISHDGLRDIHRIADQNHIPFLDMEWAFDDAALFYDDTHLNKEGARKFSQMLASWVKRYAMEE